MMFAIAAGVLLLALMPATIAVAGPPPQRIVSLNLCVDQILVDLVALGRIAALSHLAADAELSTIAEQARTLPATRGDAETVLGLDPDLVLAGTFSNAAAVSLLERVGRRVVRISMASDLDGIRVSVRQVASAVGETARGETIIAEFDQRLANLGKNQPAGTAAPTALIYQVNGLTSGRGTLDDALLAAAGLRNLGLDFRLGTGGRMPLELLVATPPDLVVLSGAVEQQRAAVADNLRHPALTAVRRNHASIELPWRTWLCGTPAVAGAIEVLGRARQALGP